jgi:hypothetical protein
MMKVSSTVLNYIHFLSEKKSDVFLKLVFPKLYGVPADEAEENGLVADNEDLETGKDLIDVVNEWAKKRGHFKKGSNINPVYADKLSNEQADKKAASDEKEVGKEEPSEENKEDR